MLRPVPKPERTPARDMAPGSSLPRPTKPIARNSGVKSRNGKRRTAEFVRSYHSDERVRFVKSLPCVACLKFGEIANAHIEGDGASRRADYTKIVPCCRTCHRQWHLTGTDTFCAEWGLTREELAVLAVDTELRWQKYQANGGAW